MVHIKINTINAQFHSKCISRLTLSNYAWSQLQIIVTAFVLCRMFGSHSRMCARCHGDITCNDLVMKARHCVFHVECFKCAQCDTSLRKGNIKRQFIKDNQYYLNNSGDLFGMFDDVLYCKLHFEMMTSYPGPVEHMDMCPPLHSPVGEYKLV